MTQRLTDEERMRIADEIENYQKVKYPWITDGGTCINSAANWLRRGYTSMFGVRSLYWLMVNRWDVLREDEDLHPILAQIPEIRKFFWERLDSDIRMEWKRGIDRWNKILEPYKHLKDQDMAINIKG